VDVAVQRLVHGNDDNPSVFHGAYYASPPLKSPLAPLFQRGEPRYYFFRKLGKTLLPPFIKGDGGGFLN
jgi:hypothetical protein